MEERPIECNHCKKEIDVTYKEVIEGHVTTWQMCHNCPILNEKLQGKPENHHITPENNNLSCNHCHTPLKSILMGEPLGCKKCYQIFQDALIKQLIEIEQLPSHLTQDPTQKKSTLHVGKGPHINKQHFHSTRIQDLNKALSKAVKGENYEEAAWLRDQINELIEKPHG